MIISLKKAPKIIDQIKKYQKNVLLVGFKAETNLTKNQLIKYLKSGKSYKSVYNLKFNSI